MEAIPIITLFVALGVLLILSAFFSVSETSMMALNRYRLKHMVREGNRGAALAATLLEMEALLFRILLAAFILLTLTVLSGVFFSEELFGRPFTASHKTVFGILSWFVFGGLLAGRFVAGWRGRTAVMWTFAGFAMLLLAYVGSKVVLELILKRG